jgi:two-component system, chemotaxis family, sensor kinase CheA
LTRAEALGLIFLPGLSTREAPSDVSGRGVGMDVVKTNISRLGGLIDVRSERSIGTKISLTLPITLAIVSALLVRISGRTYAIPLNAVSEALLLDQSTLRRVDGREVMVLRGTTVPLCRLQELFALSELGPAPRRRYAVVASVGTKRLGLVVDELLGQQDIVIKPLGASLAEVRGFSGATDLGEHHVVLVLDVSAIVEEMLSSSETRERPVEHA